MSEHPIGLNVVNEIMRQSLEKIREECGKNGHVYNTFVGRHLGFSDEMYCLNCFAEKEPS